MGHFNECILNTLISCGSLNKKLLTNEEWMSLRNDCALIGMLAFKLENLTKIRVLKLQQSVKIFEMNVL